MYNINNLVDAQFVDARNVGSPTDVLTGNYSSEETLNGDLATYNGPYYTAARLATMSINDKVFALRNARDSAGFKPSGANSVNPSMVKAFAAPVAKKK